MAETRNDATLSPGATFGRYAIVRLVGSGGMGAVYEATHLDLKKRVALKIVRPQYAENADIRARFMREGASASKIRHPHVVDVTDFGMESDVPFLVMEFLEGEGLSDKIKRDGPQPVAFVTEVLLPVCAAVAAAHDANVIHRDLKPDNVFLAKARGKGFHPKVVDFGISKVLEENRSGDLTNTSAMLGTPAYMSPEQLRQMRKVDARSDQYAMGVILYEALSGQKPFVAESLFDLMSKIVNGEYPRLRELRPEIPAELEAVIARAMHRSAESRFSSMRALGAALLPFAPERVRLLWENEFAGCADSDTPPIEAEPPKPLSPQTMRLAAVSKDVAPIPRTPTTLSGSSKELPGPPTRPRNNVALVAAGLVVVLGVAGVAVWKLSKTSATDHPSTAARAVSSHAALAPNPTPAAPATYDVDVSVQPSSAMLEADGQPVGMGTFHRTYVRDGRPHMLRVRADGYLSRSMTFSDAPPPASIVLDPAPVQPAAAAPDPQPVAQTHGSTHGARTARAAHVADTQHGTSPTGTTTTPPSTHEQVGTNGAAILQ